MGSVWKIGELAGAVPSSPRKAEGAVMNSCAQKGRNLQRLLMKAL